MKINTEVNFQPSEIIGKTVAEARQLLESRGHTLRVAVEDGQSLMLTMDYRPLRANVTVVKGVVTAFNKMG